MTTEIEAAFLPGLEALALPAEVRPGVDVAVMPGGPRLVVDASGLNHLTPALWQGSIIFRANSPALGGTRAGHDALGKAVVAWLRDRAGVVDAFASESLRLVGFFVTDIRNLEIEERLICEVEVRVGIQDLAV